MEYTFNGHKGLRVYDVGIYPPVTDTGHCINVINEWQSGFTPDSRMQPELVRLYRQSADAFYLYADVDWYNYEFNRYKTRIANDIARYQIGRFDAEIIKGKLDMVLFELVNLPLHHSINGKPNLIPGSYISYRYGNRDYGEMIDRDTVEFSKKWAWQNEWHRQDCQRENKLNLSTDKIESLWLEFAHQHGLISHKSPSPRRVDWVY